MARGSPHTACKKGKRVLLIMRDGSTVVSKFLDKKNGVVILEAGKFPIRNIRAFQIYKQPSYVDR